MVKVLSFSLGILLITACSGYETLDQEQKGPRIYLSKARTVPSIFENYTCPNNPSKIQVCHVPPGNPGNNHTICIGLPAVDAHVGHHIANNGEEDYLGDCNASEPTPDSTGNGTGGSDGGTTGQTGNGTGGTDGGTDGGTTGIVED